MRRSWSTGSDAGRIYATSSHEPTLVLRSPRGGVSIISAAPDAYEPAGITGRRMHKLPIHDGACLIRPGRESPVF